MGATAKRLDCTCPFPRDTCPTLCPSGCPACDAALERLHAAEAEAESLRRENVRLREALEQWVGEPTLLELLEREATFLDQRFASMPIAASSYLERSARLRAAATRLRDEMAFAINGDPVKHPQQARDKVVVDEVLRRINGGPLAHPTDETKEPA